MQRKSTKEKPGANKAEKDFHKWLKAHPCCVTGQSNVLVHHCKGSAFKHKKVLIGHWFCLPLSEQSHDMYHEQKKVFLSLYGHQRDLWLVLNDEYFSETGTCAPQDVQASIATVWG